MSNSIQAMIDAPRPDESEVDRLGPDEMEVDPEEIAYAEATTQPASEGSIQEDEDQKGSRAGVYGRDAKTGDQPDMTIMEEATTKILQKHVDRSWNIGVIRGGVSADLIWISDIRAIPLSEQNFKTENGDQRDLRQIHMVSQFASHMDSDGSTQCWMPSRS